MKAITAEEFDKKFDDGEDISEYIDWSKSFRPHQSGHVDIDLPGWMLFSLDREADKLGVTRQQLVQRWLEERLQERGGAGQDAAQ
jgi:hypothetical protein